MKASTTLYVFGLGLCWILTFSKAVMSMQLTNPVDMKDFVRDNAHQPYFQQLIESIQDPIQSFIAHNRVLEHAKTCLATPNYISRNFPHLPEGCFKMGIRLLYCAAKQGRQCLDDIDVIVILRRLSNQTNITAGFVDFEECDQTMNRFGELLGFIFPLIEVLVQKNIVILRLSKNHLTALPASIRCLSNLEKLCIRDNDLSYLPNEIGELRKLDYIDISRNRFIVPPGNIAHVKTIINNRGRNRRSCFFRDWHKEHKEKYKYLDLAFFKAPARDFVNSIDVKEFIKENATKPYFQSILETIQDPINSIIAYNSLLNHAKSFLMAPEFTPYVFSQIPEGSFKMALRLIYSSLNARRCLDDIDVGVILTALGKQYDVAEGYLNFEKCEQKMKNFGTLLGYIIPLIEPWTKRKIIWFRLSSNQLTSLTTSIRCLDELQKLYLDDNLLTSIPSEISQLKKLHHIDISKNRFTSIPQTIAHIPNIFHQIPVIQEKPNAGKFLC